MSRCWLLASLLTITSCGGSSGATGDSCSKDQTCNGGLCLTDNDGFPGGYCTSDCSVEACQEDASCQASGAMQLCMKTCQAKSDCRSDYMCFGGYCRPSCKSDVECGVGYGCVSGECTPLAGAGIGEVCTSDEECSSRLCARTSWTCERSCKSDEGCSNGQTCYPNSEDLDGDRRLDVVRPICKTPEGSGAVGSACKKDNDCARGGCQLGLCSNLCEINAHCSADMSCQVMPVLWKSYPAAGPPTISTCMLKTGTHEVSYGSTSANYIALPPSVQSFSIFVAANNYDIGYFTGIYELNGPDGQELYWIAQSQTELYKMPLRYIPDDGTSMALVPNSPASAIKSGVYQFKTFAQNETSGTNAYSAKVRFKFGAAAPTSGSIALHILQAKTTGCPTLSASKFNKGSVFGSRLSSIFQAAGLTLSDITFSSAAGSAASTSAVVLNPEGSTGPETQLDNLLKIATGGDEADVLELVLVSEIRVAGSSGEMIILGIAGGIPGSVGIPGTPHSGAALAVGSFCEFSGGADPDWEMLATTAAHELGHTLGLWHNTEQDGSHSPLGDDVSQGANNLMYWMADGSGQGSWGLLTPRQKAVILANPAVQ